MKITKLAIQNIKRIKAMEISLDPNGHLVTVSGRNGAGKTSLIDSIEMALAGKSSVPSRPVRDGEESARVVCRLEGERTLIVTRRFTAAGGTSLVVESEEGAKFPSPQSMLDELVGRLTFDPLDFSRMEPKRQLETLRSLVGVDVSQLDAERQAAYDKRTAVNRDVKALDARLGGMTRHEDAPEAEVSVADLVTRLEAAELTQRDVEESRREGEDANGAVELAEQAVANAQAALHRAEESRVNAAARLEDLRANFASIRDAAIDPDPIREQIANAEDVNRRVRQNATRAEQAKDLVAARSQAEALSQRIADVDHKKAEAISAVEFPVEGLAFGEHGVTFGGIPFDQASSAEQLRVSVAMGLAMNPKLRVLLIRDGSLLDEESLRLVAEMAEKADAQVWLERVSDGDEVSVLIEDGSVVERAESEDAAS